MTRWLAAAAAVAATWGAGEPVAWGQATTIHGTAEVMATYDDNIVNGPDNGDETVTPKLDDFIVTLSPGALLVHRMPRGQLTVSYTRVFAIYTQNFDVSSSADIGAIGLRYEVSPRDNLGFNVGVQRASTNLITLQTPSATTADAQQAPEPTEILTPTVAINHTHAINEDWSFGEQADATWSIPLESSNTIGDQVSAGVAMGPQVAFGNHSVGVLGALRYNFLDRPSEADATVQVVKQVVPAVLGTYAWQFAERWEQQVQLGVGFPINLGVGTAVAPLATLTTLYQDDFFGASLTLAQALVPNPLTRQIFLADTATLAVLMPLVRDQGLGVEGATGIAYNRALNLDQTVSDTSINTWNSDVALVYAPPQIPLTTSLRYQHIRQFGATGGGALQELTRNIVSLTIGTMLPPLDTPTDRAPFLSDDQPAGEGSPDGPE